MGEAHEKRLEQAIIELQSKGYHVINLENKCPPVIGMKENKLFAIIPILKMSHNGKITYNTKSKTLASLKTKYHMFDEVLKVVYVKNGPFFIQDVHYFDEKIKEFENNGFRIIMTHRCRPDGIATKDGKIFAVEVLGKIQYKNVSHNPKNKNSRINKWRFTSGVTLNSKKSYYDMFDDVLFYFWREYLDKSISNIA